MCNNAWACVNDQPHEGNGRGCVHHSTTGSDVPSKAHEDDRGES